MLRKLRPRRPSHGTVVAYMALFVALGGTAYAVNTVGSTDIIDGQVKSVDIGDGEVSSADVKNQDILSADVKDQSLTTFDVSTFLGADIVDGTLTGHDVGIYSDRFFVNSIGTVGATGCSYGGLSLPITPKDTDHIVLTPDYGTSSTNLTYTAEVKNGSAFIKVCNPTASPINGDGTFNVLVIAQ
jgi:hypothetical protein